LRLPNGKAVQDDLPNKVNMGKRGGKIDRGNLFLDWMGIKYHKRKRKDREARGRTVLSLSTQDFLREKS
jgi:hypothetical protein